MTRSLTRAYDDTDLTRFYQKQRTGRVWNRALAKRLLTLMEKDEDDDYLDEELNMDFPGEDQRDTQLA